MFLYKEEYLAPMKPTAIHWVAVRRRVIQLHVNSLCIKPEALVREQERYESMITLLAAYDMQIGNY